MVADQSATTVTITATVDDAEGPVIALAGELDLASVEATRVGIEAYLSPLPSHLTFDLEKLKFMDSSGIALLVHYSNQVDQVTLVRVSPIVRRVLEATGLLEHFGLSR